MRYILIVAVMFCCWAGLCHSASLINAYADGPIYTSEEMKISYFFPFPSSGHNPSGDSMPPGIIINDFKNNISEKFGPERIQKIVTGSIKAIDDKNFNAEMDSGNESLKFKVTNEGDNKSLHFIFAGDKKELIVSGRALEALLAGCASATEVADAWVYDVLKVQKPLDLGDGIFLTRVGRRGLTSREYRVINALGIYAESQDEFFTLNRKLGYSESSGPLEKSTSLPTTVANAFEYMKGHKAFEGYVFYEDFTVNDWSKDFAAFAIPEKYGETGRSIFWVGKEGDVYETEIASEPRKMIDKSKITSPLRSKNGWFKVSDL